MFTILVIDDDPAILELLTRILERKGFNVVGTTDPHEALEMTRSLGPDLIISDLMMPALNGYELCQQIRLYPEYADLPILILSAKTDHMTIQQCLQAGATEYATKPILSQSLVSTVQRLLDARPSGNR